MLVDRVPNPWLERPGRMGAAFGPCRRPPHSAPAVVPCSRSLQSFLESVPLDGHSGKFVQAVVEVAQPKRTGRQLRDHRGGSVNRPPSPGAVERPTFGLRAGPSNGLQGRTGPRTHSRPDGEESRAPCQLLVVRWRLTRSRRSPWAADSRAARACRGDSRSRAIGNPPALVDSSVFGDTLRRRGSRKG